MRRLLALLVAVVALACSSDGPRTPPPATPPATAEATPADAAPTDPASTPQMAPARRPLRYVALGDSLASGMQAIDGGRSYADAYARLLQRNTGRRVRLDNLGVPGLNSTELLDALRTSDEVRAAVSRADVVTWDIGGNDLIEVAAQVSAGTCGGGDGLACVAGSRDAFAQRWNDIVTELTALRRSPRVALQTFTLYRPFATVRGVHVDALLRELDARNEIIRQSQDRGVQVADVAAAFAQGAATDLIDDDGLHPTAAGHQEIARLLLSLER